MEKKIQVEVLLFKSCHIFCGCFEVNEQDYVNIMIWLSLNVKKKQCVNSDICELYVKWFCHFSSQIQFLYQQIVHKSPVLALERNILKQLNEFFVF